QADESVVAQAGGEADDGGATGSGAAGDPRDRAERDRLRIRQHDFGDAPLRRREVVPVRRDQLIDSWLRPHATNVNLVKPSEMEVAGMAMFDSVNPARPAEVVGTYPQHTAADVDAAVARAAAAQKTWARVPVPARAEVIAAVGGILTERKAELARLVSTECG